MCNVVSLRQLPLVMSCTTTRVRGPAATRSRLGSGFRLGCPGRMRRRDQNEKALTWSGFCLHPRGVMSRNPVDGIYWGALKGRYWLRGCITTTPHHPPCFDPTKRNFPFVESAVDGRSGKEPGSIRAPQPGSTVATPLALCMLSAARGGIICPAAVPVMCERGELRKDAECCG